MHETIPILFIITIVIYNYDIKLSLYQKIPLLFISIFLIHMYLNY